MASEGLHESAGDLDDAVIDRHRAIKSIMEELDAIDWYDQRVEATRDASLAEVLAHNRDEEKEHAAMTIEWLRRRDPILDRHLRTYLFTDGSIVAEEEDAEHEDGAPDADGGDMSSAPGDGSLRIGSLRDDPRRTS
jgi:uncharacterized protein